MAHGNVIFTVAMLSNVHLIHVGLFVMTVKSWNIQQAFRVVNISLTGASILVLTFKNSVLCII